MPTSGNFGSQETVSFQYSQHLESPKTAQQNQHGRNGHGLVSQVPLPLRVGEHTGQFGQGSGCGLGRGCIVRLPFSAFRQEVRLTCVPGSVGI